MLYDYRCKSCLKETEAVNRIAERRTNAPVCCDEKMEIWIKQAPMGFVDREVRYMCPETGIGVTSRNQRNEIMARNNLVDANDLFGSKVERAKEKQAWDKKIAKIKAEDKRAQAELTPMQKQQQDNFLAKQMKS